MDPTEASEMREIVLEAARRVFPSCGVPIGDAFEPSDDGQDADSQRLIVAFMGFVGRVLRGTMAFVAPLELMRKAYPLSLEQHSTCEFDVFDWSGEVANQLFAHVKNSLASCGVEIEASTPRVILAEQLHVTRSVRGTVCSTCFASGDAWIKVWFDGIAPAGQRVLGDRSRDSPTPPEGDVLLF